MKTGVLIVSAGTGSRLGSDVAKQYMRLGDKIVLRHSLDIFVSHSSIDYIQVVISESDRSLYDACISDLAGDKLLDATIGGTTRQQSVLCGLEALSGVDITNVLIHDAARPFLTHSLIDSVLAGLTTGSAVVPTLPISDTLKRVSSDSHIIETVDRSHYVCAQTPQGFRFSDILRLHRGAAESSLTDFPDDSALAEWGKSEITIVSGATSNIKLTYPADLERAHSMISSPDIRTGHGYDTHSLGDGDSVRLCGVDIPHNRSLVGHSDADVGFHALTDAILSTIADGDIGMHFPPTDSRWRHKPSEHFLRDAISRLHDSHGTLTHCDITLICESPVISPHRDAMRSEISRITGIDISRVSVKATTNEGLGFIGRGEGIAAMATASVIIVSL